MTKATNTATQAAPIPQEPDEQIHFREVNGVYRWHEEPEHTTIVLEAEALRRIGAALSAIKTCSDLLNDRESDMASGTPALGQIEANGLLAAITCCAELIDSHVNDRAAEGVLKLKGEDAKEVGSQAWRTWHRSYMKGGRT